jgi:hypothetical protein
MVSLLLSYHQAMPICAHDRLIDLSELVEVRRNSAVRISWPVIFMKAYSLVGAANPILRRWHQDFPWKHQGESPDVVPMVAVTRRYRDDDWLFFGRFDKADQRALDELQTRLDQYQTHPVEIAFRTQRRFSMYPRFVRRLVFWGKMNLSGNRRLKRLGTFGLTTISGAGATIQMPPTPNTSAITYGPMDENEQSLVTIAYDHRLMDGMTVARLLQELDDTLHGPVLQELRELAGS